MTGAAHGIGRAISEELLRQGCHVVLHYHTYRPDIDQLLAYAKDLSTTAYAVGADLTHLIMLGFMGMMYKNKQTNRLIIGVSIAVFIGVLIGTDANADIRG